MRCIHFGGFSRSLTSKRCCSCCLRCIFRTAVRCILNVLRARQPFRFSRSAAFAIDRGRCRFRVRNALHSFRRLFTLAYKRCRSCCLRYIFLYSCTLPSNYSAARQALRFLRPTSPLTEGEAASVRGMHCIDCSGFSRKQAMQLLLSALHVSYSCTLSSNYSAARQ